MRMMPRNRYSLLALLWLAAFFIQPSLADLRQPREFAAAGGQNIAPLRHFGGCGRFVYAAFIEPEVKRFGHGAGGFLLRQVGKFGHGEAV